MAAYVYDRINVILKDSYGNEFPIKHMTSFDDQYIDETIIESDIKIDGVERGWIGDMFMVADVFYDVEKDCNKIKEDRTIYIRKDVLCARVTACYEHDSIVSWKYTFLKS